MLTGTPYIPVALLHQTGYARPALLEAVERVFTACGLDFARGERVLVKPNLVSRNNAALSCTHPEVVRAVCAHLLDCGARPTVADSPAFGSAGRVAAACGLTEALSDLGLRVATLDRPTPLKLSDGGSIGLSRRALEADRILSVARLKAHGQFRVTASTKNLFGAVCGCRKALAHVRLGELSGRMERLVLDVRRSLPPGAPRLLPGHPGPGCRALRHPRPHASGRTPLDRGAHTEPSRRRTPGCAIRPRRAEVL